MKKKLLWIFLLSLFIFSCSSDNSDVVNSEGDNNVEGNNGIDPDTPDGGTVTIDPSKVLSLITTELIGKNCANGGLKVELGIDANGNGTLDMDEITNTDFVCNGQKGEQGEAGTNGKSTLISTEIEAIGANCESGGVKINIGLDTNNNGALDTDEITVEDFICNAIGNGLSGGITNIVLTGNITDEEARIKIENTVGSDTQFVLIRNSTNLTTVDLSGISEAIEVDIQNNAMLTNITFPDLENVVDFIKIKSNPKLVTTGFPLLKTVSDMNFGFNEMLSSIQVPLLNEVFEFVDISSNLSLESLEFPSLSKAKSIQVNNNSFTAIDFNELISVESLSITTNNSLSTVNISELVSTGDLFISSNNLLSEFSAPKLKNTDSINVLDNDSLSSLNFPLLEGSFFGVFVSRNQNLVSVDFNSLNKSSVAFDSNRLTEISLPSLVESSSINFFNNSSLAEINLSILKKAGNVSFNSNNSLASVNLTQLNEFNNLTIINNSNLENFDLSSVSNISSNITFAIPERVIPDNNNNGEVSNPENPLGLESNIRIFDNSKLRSFSLPLLTNVEKTGFTFSRNSSLTTIDISNASGINNQISISENNLLQEINFENFTTLVQLVISNNETLVDVNFMNLSLVDRSDFRDSGFPYIFSVENNISLVNLTFPRLTKVLSSNGFSNNLLRINFNEKLETFEVPLLDEAFNIFVGNNAIENITFPSLRTFGELDINEDLNSASVDLLLRQFASIIPAIRNRLIYISSPVSSNNNQARIDFDFLIANDNKVSVNF